MACLLGTYNRIDSATLSGGSWLPALPLTNLQNKILGKVSRSADTDNSSTVIKLNLVQARSIRVLALVNHNLSIGSTYRIRGGDTDSVLLYDSGIIETWPSVYDSEDLEWEDSSYWLGTYNEEEITGYTTAAVHILDSNQVHQYWQIDIFDDLNAAGYVQVGRVFIGSAWEPENDAEVGLQLGWETNTQTQKALNGSKYFQRRTPYRVTKFTFNVMSVDESMANAFEIDRRTGLDGEVLWIHDINDTVHALRRRFLGNLRELSPIEYPYANLTRKAYTIEEAV